MFARHFNQSLMIVRCTLPMLVAAALAVPANGSILGWANAGGGSASLAANWSPAQIPASVDDLVWNMNANYGVTFNATVLASRTQTYRDGTVTLTVTSPHAISTGLTVGDLNLDNAIMTLTTGMLTSNAATIVGDAVGSTGRINVNDDDADLNIGNSADLIVGNNGAGTLSITGTGHVQVADQFIAGSNSTSVSTTTVSGFSVAPIGISLLETLSTGQSRIGAGGDATLTVDTGAQAHFSGDLVIANGSASNSSVTVQTVGLLNASLAVDGDLLIGRNISAAIAAGTGTLNLNTGGTASVDFDTFLGDPDGGTGILHMGGGIFNGSAPITVLAGSTINGFGAINADINNAGNIQPSGTGLIIDGLLTNTTSNQIVGTKINFGAGGGYSGSGTCQADITGSSTSSITPTGTLSIGANTTAGYSYNGALNVGGNIVTLLDTNGAVLGGLTTINSGRIECPAGIGLANGGKITGDGLLVGTLTAAGVIDAEFPGRAGGLITVQGDLHMNPTGIIDIAIGGTPQSGNYDRVVVSGTATFGGTVRVTIENNFIPHPGMQYVAVNAIGGRNGECDAVIEPTVCNGVTFVLVYSSTAVIVLVRPPDADVTRDGHVNVDDLLGVINGWGQGGGSGNAANVNGADPVNVDDLLFLINHWGACQ